MRKLSTQSKYAIETDKFFKKCARHKEGNCEGRITIEHVLIYGGRQIDDSWTLLPICAFHHAVDQFQDRGDLQKEVHEWIVLCRATDEQIRSISKAVNYQQKKKYLISKYGNYSER